jgi:PAS domain S-box-containing protein
VEDAPDDLARSALDAAPDAMMMIDASGIICYANHQVSALFQYSRNEVVGRPIEELLPERFRTRHVGHRQGYVSNTRVRPMGLGLDLFGLRRDGSEFPVEISLSPIVDGGRILVAAAIRDITDRKRVEAQLIVARQAAESARAAADEARAIADEARDLADRANQGKSRFLATASHDLRQPLQSLALLNGTLRRVVTDAVALDAIEQQGQTIDAMSRLLNALLDISKLESGAIKPEPSDFTVASIFEELRAEFASLAAAKGLKLEVESCADCVHSDRSLVEQILRNLVSNAIKYTKAGWVRLRCRHEPGLVRVQVLDTGVGIAAEQISLIFDEFYQVGVAANSSRDGYGLGLSIVQRLVKLLTLQLDVQSEIGKGSTFSLQLPAGQRPAAAAAAAARRVTAANSRLGRAHVLLVEDDPAVRGATRMLLKVEGYTVTSAGSMAEALQQASKDIDVILTDYHLSEGETGADLIAAMREKLGSNLKAVLMTGDTSSAMQNMPRDPLLRLASKPIDADALLALLRGLLAA